MLQLGRIGLVILSLMDATPRITHVLVLSLRRIERHINMRVWSPALLRLDSCYQTTALGKIIVNNELENCSSRPRRQAKTPSLDLVCNHA